MQIENKEYKKLSDRQKEELAILLVNYINEMIEKQSNENINNINNTDRIHIDTELLQMLISHLTKYNNILKYIDLSEISFDGISVLGLDFEGTNVNIDPQKVKNKDLSYTNFKGIDMSYEDFTYVYIRGINLEDTRADIDPQLVIAKDLLNCNLKGLDLSGKDFTDVNIKGTNLEDTGAYIDLTSVRCITDEFILNTNLKGCYVTHFSNFQSAPALKDAILLDTYYEKSKKYIKALFNKD